MQQGGTVNQSPDDDHKSNNVKYVGHTSVSFLSWFALNAGVQIIEESPLKTNIPFLFENEILHALYL
jgi:hypothetical protein